MSLRRILIVEDNPMNLKLVRDILHHSGYEVVEAITGEDGVRLADETLPDLILMDLQLPGIDGYEALRQIRASRQGRDIPALAVTAFAMQDDRDQAYEYGFDGYIEKPIHVRELAQKVRELLETGGES